ncbi:hypothetical protein HDU90_005726 [Geranomyces variabilis]|nr:hypothetical protein HDU90_005726 [Geranomyces variabilis]
MLASLDVTGEGGGAEGFTASTTDVLDSMDISALLQQMDSAQGALDLLETRTDWLMQKIDSLLDEHAADKDDESQPLGDVEEAEKGETSEPLPSTATAPPPHSSANRKGTSDAFADDTKTLEAAAPKTLPVPDVEDANR